MRKISIMLKRIVILIFSFSIFSFFVSCSKEEKKGQPPLVVIYPVIAVDIPDSYTAVGDVVARESVNLIARVDGYLTKRLFEPGDFVKKGQLLFQIQQAQYVAQVEQAKAALLRAKGEYENAMIEYNRYALLSKQQAVSEENFDYATQNRFITEGDVESAEAELALQELNLSYTEISAPFDGRVGMYNYSVGNYVNINSNTLAQVIKMDPIWVEFPMSETNFLDILKKPDIIPTETNSKIIDDSMIIKVTLASGKSYPHLGKIDFVATKIDSLTGTIQVRAVFENKDELLLPGGYVTVTVESLKKYSRLLIPQSSMLDDQYGTFVYIVNKDNIVKKQYIKKGKSAGNMIIVDDGLKEGENIVIYGLLRVKPGTRVRTTIGDNNISSFAILPDEATVDSNKISNSYSSDTKIQPIN